MRQGDFISIYIFVLCIERLGHLIELAISEGWCKRIKLSRIGHVLLHLFFADDLILFAKAFVEQIQVVMACEDGIEDNSDSGDDN